MDFQIGAILLQDGLSNGAIYLLLGLALVLVFSVTRVLYLPQGEFVTFGALGYALLLRGELPGTVWLLLIIGAVTAVCDVVAANGPGRARVVRRTLVANIVLPAAIVALAWLALSLGAPPAVLALIAVAIVVPMGPMIYRIGFMPVAHASILTLMIISVAIHYMLVGLSLAFFGPEGMRVAPLVDGGMKFGDLLIPAQGILVYVAAACVVGALYVLFEHTLYGKALRATAVSRNGARLLGIRTHAAGKLAFGLAAGIGALCGVLLVSLTTVYYDSGLAIGMKGFIGAVVGALVSFPATALGALGVGVIEAYSAFFASALKDAILFMAIVPVLLYLSLRHINVHAQEEEQ